MEAVIPLRAGAIVAAIAAIAAIAAAVLPSGRFPIDRPASQVEFHVRVLLVRRIDGRLPGIDGHVRFGEDGRTAAIEARIDVTSLEMKQRRHRRWALSEEFFDAGRHRWIDFSADAVPVSLLREGGVLQGQLTLRGIQRPIELEVEPATCERIGFDCPVQARAVVERHAFGMRARSFVVGDDVPLDFSIRLQDGSATP